MTTAIFIVVCAQFAACLWLLYEAVTFGKKGKES